MRRLLLFLLPLMLLLLPSGCATEAPSTLITLREADLTPLLAYMPDADASLWYDTTPPALDGMGWRIYRHGSSCATLLLTEAGLFPLGEFFGGWGVTSAVPCDADDDGSPELLLTYSWGSGMHRSILAVYHVEERLLIPLATFYRWEEDLVLLPPTCRAETPLSSCAISEYPVWLAEVDVPDYANYADLRFTLVQPVGTVTENHGLGIDLDLPD